MARGKKKDTAPATPAPEATETATAPQEGQETPQEQPSAQQGQDNTPQTQEGQESGQESREAVPGQEQPEPEEVPGPAPEPTADPEPEQQQGPYPAPEAPTTPEDTDPAHAREMPLPYKGTVAVSLAVLHKAVGVGTADMLKAVGTLRQGTPVTVTGRNGPFVQLKNGLWMKESFLEA